MLHDGTFVGNTHCAVYDRTALEPAWRSSPKGFAVHHSYSVPRTLKASLKDRGWHFRSFDTGRVINLQLLLAGFELELRRVVPELHHVGGISMRDFRGLQAWARRMAQILRSGPDGRIRMIANGALERIYARAQRPPSHQPRMRRRRAVLSHVDEALDAILAGEPTPPAVRTDSAEVDRRVAALVATLEEQYPKGIARLRAATEAPPLDTRPEMRPSPAPPLS